MTARAGDNSDPDASVIPVIEETAEISTQRIVTGRVRVSTTVEEFQDIARGILQSETMTVTRVAIDRPVDTPPAIRTEGDVTIIPVLEEILVVEKRLMLKEELHVRKTTASEIVAHPVTLRRQRAVVERYDDEGTPVETQPTA